MKKSVMSINLLGFGVNVLPQNQFSIHAGQANYFSGFSCHSCVNY
jgi:hypothetical protein